ncbi:hypothetical protein C8R45DRAFT_842158, partial [Mycena sanguinolenta]
ASSSEFVFDLSVTNFSPCRVVAPEHLVAFTIADLQQSAFHPPVTKLRITCDRIPQWPIDLPTDRISPVPLKMSEPPITLGDVLVAIHRKMHHPITHADWNRLSPSEQDLIARAFTRRCRREGTRSGTPYSTGDELPERQKGVKLVDFLQGNNMFRGLAMQPDGVVKMVVSQRN